MRTVYFDDGVRLRRFMVQWFVEYLMVLCGMVLT